MRSLARFVALALVLGAVPAGAGTAADSTAAPAALRFGRRDAIFAGVATVTAAVAATQDRRWSAQASANDTRFALDLAADARRLGEPVTVGAALAATDALARLAHREGVAAACERIAVAEIAAGTVTIAAKMGLGRERPDETSNPGRFRPFSSHDAMPSGHSTTAFALAAALDAETHTRWVPALAYPAAALTSWSRLRDHRHWPSDVVAGAALGAWVAHHADVAAQAWWPRGLLVVVWPHRGGASLRASLPL